MSANDRVVRIPRPQVPVSGARAFGPGDEVLVAVTHDGALRAYANRCLHLDRPLHDGLVRDGVLTCPHHLWRFRVEDGTPVACGAAARGRALTALPLEADDGEVRVPLPPPPPGLRDRLLTHAREWTREPT